MVQNICRCPTRYCSITTLVHHSYGSDNQKCRKRTSNEIKAGAFVAFIWGNKEEEIQEQLDLWNQEFKNFGLKISKTKTVLMAVSREHKQYNVTLEGERVQQVEEFSYLGSTVTSDNRNNREIINRVHKGAQFFQQVRTLLWDEKIPVRAKKTMYSSYYIPITTYGLETCTTSKREESKVQAGEMKFLRSCLQRTRRDRIRNEVIREELEIKKPLLDIISQARLRWYGHVQRMDEERTAKIWLNRRVEGNRMRGRPRKRWEDQVRKEVEERGVEWDEVIQGQMFMDRKRWRGVVNHTRETGAGQR